MGLWQQACSTTIEPAGSAFSALLHAGEVQAVGRRVVVAVGLDREAGRLEELAVVLPARLADPDLGRGADAACRKSAPIFRPPVPPSACTVTMLFLLTEAKNQFLHRAVVGRQAVDRQVAARAATVFSRSLSAWRTHSSSGILPLSSV